MKHSSKVAFYIASAVVGFVAIIILYNLAQYMGAPETVAANMSIGGGSATIAIALLGPELAEFLQPFIERSEKKSEKEAEV